LIVKTVAQNLYDATSNSKEEHPNAERESNSLRRNRNNELHQVFDKLEQAKSNYKVKSYKSQERRNPPPRIFIYKKSPITDNARSN
jgi:hypothetical protein